MTNRIKMLTGLALAALLAMSAPYVWADTNPDDDSDALTITITPNINIGVDITTDNITLSYTLTQGNTQYFVNAATATVLGNASPQEWDVRGFNLDTWTLDADEAAATDSAQLYLLFATGRTSAPVEGEFSGTTKLVTSGAETRAGVSPGTGVGNYENASMQGTVDVDSMGISNARQMWFRLDSPPTTSVSANQRFHVRLTATITSL